MIIRRKQKNKRRMKKDIPVRRRRIREGVVWTPLTGLLTQPDPTRKT